MADTLAPVGVVLVGAGQRGRDVFGRWALANPDRLRFRAVVEPDPSRRAVFGDAHAIPSDRRFETLEAYLAAVADLPAAIVATPDREHAQQALPLLQAGHQVLLEKPIARSLTELRWLIVEAGDAIERLNVAFELRLTTFYRRIHEIVTSGRLGDIVTVSHAEHLAPWFMAHSYVRGIWGRLADATPAIVAKCSHDFDLLAWNSATPIRRMASFGSLGHFRPPKAPDGATARCTDGCPVRDCLFDARRIYLDLEADSWLIPVVSTDATPEGITVALANGPYGRCVYHAGSDVVDHQVVSMETEDGVTLTLTLNGHSYQRDASIRVTRYDGTRATLRAIIRSESGAAIEVADHDGGVEHIEVDAGPGHGGGDARLLEAFVDRINGDASSGIGGRDALEGHLLAFAAEEARVSGAVVDVAGLREELLETASTARSG